jgi:three-Cys-motif partner protein
MPKREYEWSFENPPTIKSHSLAKHRVLKQYLERYIQKLASNFMIQQLKFYIVDGFAGGGIYTRQDSGELHWGSPVIIHDTIAEAERNINQHRRNKFDIQYHLYLTEPDAGAFKVLQQTLQSRGIVSRPGKIVESYNQSFESMAEKIRLQLLQNSTNTRVIFNLDQYGWSKISMLQIQNILHTLPNAEILLTFTADWILDYLPQHIDNPEFTGILKSLRDLGILHNHRDLQELNSIKESPEWRRLSQAFFSEKMRENSGARFYTPFFIKTADSHRHYWLLHFSQHEIAHDEMVKVHWSEQNASYHPGGSGFNMLGYDSGFDYSNVYHHQLGLDFTFNQTDRDISVKTMAEQLPQMIHGSSHTSIRQILRCNGNTTPGSSDMIRDSLDILLGCGEIVATGHKNNETRQKGSAIHLDDLITLPRQRSIFPPLFLK